MMTLRAPGSHRLLDHIPLSALSCLAAIQTLRPRHLGEYLLKGYAHQVPERSGLEQERTPASSNVVA
jgi:hypothetical protein